MLVMAVLGSFIDRRVTRAARGQFLKNSLNHIFGPLYEIEIHLYEIEIH